MARRLLIHFAALLATLALAPGQSVADAQDRVGAFVSAAQTCIPANADESSCARPGFTAESARIAAGCCVATKGEDDLLGAARAARDKKAAEVGSSKATVTGGYDPATGKVVAGCNRNPFGCAEDDVARLLGIPDKDIRFTEAIRPRTGREVPVCRTCQGKYDRSQFPPGTRFDEP